MKSQFTSEKFQIEKNAKEQIETIKTELATASGATQNQSQEYTQFKIESIEK
jgi:hypothetical protein